MIVPQYWAEGRVRHRKQGKQITARRFGWSDISQQDAQTNADHRAEEALQRLLSGEKLPRREPKIPYNGADGIPIREEILDRRGETIITRNSYGASCLNTPNVFFADVDFSESTPPQVVLMGLALASTLSAVILFSYGYSLLTSLMIVSVTAGFGVVAAEHLYRYIQSSKGSPEQAAKARITKFLAIHCEWNFRIYRTPAGLRVLATHQPFDPSDPQVATCFKALGTDPIYQRMCLKQRCFRPRVSPKPWRIGIGDHMRPRPGTWPVNPERLPIRNAWIARYLSAASGFASCQLMESMGSGAVHPDVLPVVEWHDELSRATTDLPIA